MIRRFCVLTLLVSVAVTISACSTDTELGGVRIPNSRPDTRITGQPPTLLEAGFAVEFFWTGSDPDGKIVGYEWKISDNGLDGISPRDTLTIDPLTGAVLNPWNFTAANDSIFFVLADQADFPGDPEADPRSFRTHSLFIRSVDDKGAVDPTPAYISFTSTTLVPSCWVVFPNLGSVVGAVTAPPTVNVGWGGEDIDFDLRVPTKVRFLWKSAKTLGGAVIRDRFTFDQNAHEVLSFDSQEWEPWIRYGNLPENRKVAFQGQPHGEYFLFAVQVQDTAGAVSVGLGYQSEVAHVWVKRDFFTPDVDCSEIFLGSQLNNERKSNIAGGQPLNFSWSGDASSYNGEIISYRHGWDLTAPNDPNDPGWAVPPGLSEQNLFAEERAFQEGLHTFYLRVEDDSNQVTWIVWKLNVIPYVERDNQFPVVLVDQIVDTNVQNWQDRGGNPRNDESYRNAYWHFLADGAGGVADINWERDFKDHSDLVEYADLVQYKAVICFAAFHSSLQRVFNQFRPDRGGRDQFVWFTPYQERGGNLLLCGASSMDSFIKAEDNYVLPVVFDTRETRLFVNNREFISGFGERTLPDDSRILRGPTMYPYATAGISALDWTSPQAKFIYGRQTTAKFDRHVDCVGLKGLVLNEDFRTFHTVGPGVIPDTMYTNPEIDWHDSISANGDSLQLFSQMYPWRTDEFVNSGNQSARTTPIIEQECNPDFAPNGLCIEPMFNGISRFDWVREYFWAKGDTDWPDSRYDIFALDNGCGSQALTAYGEFSRGSSKLNNKTYGYFSYKVIEDKPVQRADVYWGFDPYRFDKEGSQKAIRWVMKYFGLTINQ